jgi:hypothetical protein
VIVARSPLFAQKNEWADVADHLQHILKPIAPPPVFRERLRDNLQMAAEHQRAHHASHRRRDTAWGWLIGAALLGALIGFIAIQLRARRKSITV